MSNFRFKKNNINTLNKKHKWSNNYNFAFSVKVWCIGLQYKGAKQNLPLILFRLLIIDIFINIHNNIHMNKTYIVALIAVLIICSFTANCPVEHAKQHKIYSDSVGLTAQDNKIIGNAQNLIYNYKFQQNFPVAPNIAVGLNQIQSAPSPALDIRVTNAKVTPSGVYFQAESGDKSQWKQIKINFLASSRDDIQLGSTSISSPILNPNDNTFNVIYSIKGNLPQSGLKAKSFLQGINLHSADKTQIGIKQESSSISNKQIFFTFSSPLKTSIVRSLTISVIVFNIYTPSILYADGIIDQNFVVSTLDLTIPRHGIDELRTYIVGINSFETSNQKPISIYSAVSQKFTIVIGPIDRTQIDFISVSYLVLSVIDCGSCAGNPILFEGICQPNCPKGYIAAKSRCVPEKCRQGQKFNDKQQCVDICGAKEQYQSGTCICIDGFYRINNICDQCPQGTYYDFVSLSCKSLCGANSDYRNGKCFCKAGFFVINNKCQQCPYGSTFNINTKRCQRICRVNQVFSPQGCVCTLGFNRINGNCSRCPYLTVYDPEIQKCVCGQGLELVYGQCLPVCAKNQARVSGTCTCAPGFYQIDGQCKKCGLNSQYSALYSRCICNDGFIQTPVGCAPNCTNQQYFLNGKCINYCKSAFQTFVSGVCQCLSDYERVNGVCGPSCLINQYRDINGSCLCLPGYFKGTYPICQLVKCPVGTVFDTVRIDCISQCRPNEVFINGACVCGYGYNNNNAYGDCIVNCSSLEDNLNGFCQCKAGYARAALGVCYPLGSGPGRCPPGSIYMYGLCVPPTLCGANQYWSGTQCNCVNGYYRVNGQCVPVQPTLICPEGSISNGLNCLCREGLYPVVPGSCRLCPEGTTWDGYQCNSGNNEQCRKGWQWNSNKGRCYHVTECKQNQQWDGIRCRCQQGLFFVAGKCQTCPTRTVFDGFKCSPSVAPKYCTDPYSFWNGYSCVCLSGYWPLTDGKCISCPTDTYWDGTCCKPTNGQYIPLTTVI